MQVKHIPLKWICQWCCLAEVYTLAWYPMHMVLKGSLNSVIWTMFTVATWLQSGFCPCCDRQTWNVPLNGSSFNIALWCFDFQLTQATAAGSSEVMGVVDLFVEVLCEYKATLRDIFLWEGWRSETLATSQGCPAICSLGIPGHVWCGSFSDDPVPCLHPALDRVLVGFRFFALCMPIESIYACRHC